MTKDDILEKSRKENKNGDERDKKIMSDAIKFSYIIMVLFAAVFAFIRSQQGYPMMDLTAVCCASVSSNFIYRFIKTKEKSHLMIALITLVAGIYATIRFFMGN